MKAEIWRRAAILILSAYLFLYFFPFPFDQLPGLSDLLDYYDKLMDTLGLWLGKSVLHISGVEKHELTGSGDTTLDFVRLILLALLAILSAVCVLIFDREKRNYNNLFSLARRYATYCLGLYMLIYGFTKVLSGQFGAPNLHVLEETVGNSSPMGLLWTFMGASKPYTFFSGLMEVIGGYLLFFGRTRTLGALLSSIVMLNVMMLNYCYDVPVKLFSSHLFLCAVLILFPDVKQLLRFLLRYPVENLEYAAPVYHKKYKRILFVWGKLVLLTGFSAVSLYHDYMDEQEMEKGYKASKLDATYRPTFLVMDKDTLIPYRKPQPWRKMLIESEQVVLTTVLDSTTTFRSVIDTAKKTLIFISYKDSMQRYPFTYSESKGHLMLKGKWRGKDFEAEFQKRKVKNYLLMNRGFHWINEYPFNR
jgi:hypothetical protein